MQVGLAVAVEVLERRAMRGLELIGKAQDLDAAQGIRAIVTIAQVGVLDHPTAIALVRDPVASEPAREHHLVLAQATVNLVAARRCHDRVIASTAGQRVVARAAIKLVGAAIPGQAIAELTAPDRFDANQLIDAIRAGRLAGRQVHRHRARRVAVVGPVETCPAIERVVALHATQEIVARVTCQAVVVVTATDVLDAGELVGAVGTSRLILGQRQVDRHRTQRTPVVRPVGTCTAIEPVIALHPAQPVVARVAHQLIGVIAATHPLDADELVISVRTTRLAFGELHRHRTRRVAIVSPVETGTAIKPVVALSALQEVVGRIARQLVTESATTNMLNTDELVTAIPGRLIERQVHGHGTRSIGVKRPVVDSSAAVKRVIAGTAIERVVACTAIEQIITRPAVEHVVARATQQRIIAIRAIEQV